jgi:hypothetical protein
MQRTCVRCSRASAAGLALCAFALGHHVAAAGLPASQLETLAGDRWVTWWASDRAPCAWTGPDPAVSSAVRWQSATSGVQWGTLEIRGTGEAWRLSVVVVRLDPALLRFELVQASREAGTIPAWSLDAMPREAVVGLNAGQFTGGLPWGWLVHGGRVVQPQAPGPLSMAFCVRADGAARLVPADEIAMVAGTSVAEAFQSYPLLLRGDGSVPPQLARPGLGVDVGHRDARLAVGELRDGRILIVLTRFAAAGDALGSLPFGPTVPETAALLGALGCRQAMMLDGGISAQLAVREANGALLHWRGWRKVPVALLAYPRTKP